MSQVATSTPANSSDALSITALTRGLASAVSGLTQRAALARRKPGIGISIANSLPVWRLFMCALGILCAYRYTPKALF